MPTSNVNVRRSGLLVGSGATVGLERGAVEPGVAGPDEETARYRYGDASRDGIGKFYMGREISFVMGHRGAAWLDRPERAVEEQPDRVADELEALAPRSEWVALSKRLILHGRRVCFARRPRCESCVLEELCPRARLFNFTNPEARVLHAITHLTNVTEHERAFLQQRVALFGKVMFGILLLGSALEVAAGLAHHQRLTNPFMGMLVLATAVLPNQNKDLFELFKVPINADGFLVEAHAKLRPVDFATEGVFLCGLAHGPKPLDETIAQAAGAAARG